MIKYIKENYALFLSGFLQVSLVSINVYQVANKHYIGAFIIGFLISLTWSYNVKKVSFGSVADRFIYASGAAFGTIFGLFISTTLYRLLGL